MSSFLSLGVPERLAAVLAASGKAEAFPIQQDTLPDSLAGRDVLGRGRTGSGKTIAFAVPLVARLSASGTSTRPNHPRGLVLAPTRELASQIASVITPLADAAGLSVTTIFGGVSQRPQEQTLRRGVDIVVACPGRLEDLMKQGLVSLDAVEITVLDEADHMADMGFLPGVTRILKATPMRGQRLLFSATLDNGIDALVKKFLHNPVHHEVDESSIPAAAMTHRVFVVADADAKKQLVRHLAQGRGRRILFTRTKHHAKKLARQLTAAGIPAVDLQGNLSQNARERNLAAFSADPEEGGVRVMVATDVAARGVDIAHVELVVHVDPPTEHKAYLHRSGRTARAGETGTVVTVTLPEQRRDVTDLLRKAKIKAALEPVQPADDTVSALVGPQADYVKPAPAPVQAPQRPKGSRPAGGRRRSSQRPASDASGTSQRRRRSSQHAGAQHAGSQHASSQHAGRGQGSGRGQGAGRSQGATHSKAPRTPSTQPGRTASGRPTIGAVVGRGSSRGRSGSRRASYPGGR